MSFSFSSGRGRDRQLTLWTVCLVAALGAFVPRAAAFCGFYVAGADQSLYANATMVVMMRDGTRTVLSMQNNYEGPPDAFALVVPVPTVLTQDQVKILPKDVFTHVDTLGAPRLVEYWEVDPCQPQPQFDGLATVGAAGSQSPENGTSVVVEAKFSVGEYDVVILSASDSSGLETWLHDNSYNIPDGAGDVLAPYVAAGTKFFVAKVDPSRVTFVDGQAALSPLRFYYDTPEFSLPVRLGLLNSEGTQDLIVNILAPARYEVANYPNVLIPTNIRVQNEVRDGFPAFYEALLSQVLQSNPGAVVTEYSWDSGSCDPCPTPPLDQSDLATLGADVTKGLGSDQNGRPVGYVSYTLTRLHYRYTHDTLAEDLVFKEAPAIVGGRGIPNAKGELDPTVMDAGVNNFQGRYVILHAWDGELTCQSPVRGVWGGPSGAGTAPQAQSTMNTALTGSPVVAGDLSALLAESLPELGVTAAQPLDPLKPAPTLAAGSGGAGGLSAGGSGGAAAGASGASGAKATGGSSGHTSIGDKAGASGSAVRSAAGAPAAAGAAAPASRSKTGCSCRIGAPGASGAAESLSMLYLLVFGLRRRKRQVLRGVRS